MGDGDQFSKLTKFETRPFGEKSEKFQMTGKCNRLQLYFNNFHNKPQCLFGKKKNLITLLRKNELEMPNSFSKILDLQFMVV